MSVSRVLDLIKQTFREFGQDKAPRLGAALAYYTIFSLGPLLLIAVAMAGIFFGQEAARGQISRELSRVLGTAAAESVEQMIESAAKPDAGLIATIIGIVTLLFGATGVVNQLKDALNTIWNVEENKRGGIRGLVLDRLLSMAMVLGIGFLLLVTLVIDAAISGMGAYVSRIVGGEVLLQAVQLTLSLVLVTVLFAAIFKVLPDLTVAWRDVWMGALFTSVLFVLGKFGIGLYLGKAAVGSSYGAAGSLVILLVWVYWSAQIMFLGAEFTQVYARTYGSLRGDRSKQEARAQAARPEDRPRAVEPETAAARSAASPVAAGEALPAKRGSAGKVVAGGFAGLAVGAFVGGVSAVVVLVKTVKRLLPFR
jgi:membrane protein